MRQIKRRSRAVVRRMQTERRWGGGLSKKTGRVALRMRCDESEVARPGLAVLHMASQTLQVAPSTRFIAHLITILRRWHPCQLSEGRDGLPALASW
jgi:hypothetical protein